MSGAFDYLIAVVPPLLAEVGGDPASEVHSDRLQGAGGKHAETALESFSRRKIA